MTNKKTLFFTLLEVTVALAILAMGLTGLLSITAASKKRASSGYDKWFHQHLIAQAAEFYLLNGPDETPPNIIFPYENYSVTCSIESVDNLPEDMENTLNDWQLVAYKITLSDENGVLESINVEKIVKYEE